jgi:hypothetical protein
MKAKKSKETCPKCHGTGKVTCSRCNGKGVRRCSKCKGTGHSCPVCDDGHVVKTRWINCERCHGKGYRIKDGERHRCYSCDGRGQVKEEYKEICPNCHGDYNNTKHGTCKNCGGEGKVSCPKTERCSMCDGAGHVTMIFKSKSNLRIFKALSLIVGFTGIQYLYIKRWALFALQLLMFAATITALCFGNILTPYMTKFSIDLETFKNIRIILSSFILLNVIIGAFFIKLDGKGAFLQDEYKKGWFWFFATFFGITGAHLAYTKERLLLGAHLLWVTTPFISSVVTFCSEKNIHKFVIGAIIGGLVISLFEVILAKIVNAICGTSFLQPEK